MKKTIVLMCVFTTLLISSFAQEREKEVIEKDGVRTQVAISDIDVYEGSQSEEARKLYNKAVKYGSEGDLGNAEKFYIKAIKKDATYVEAYDNLGLVYRKMGKYDKAIENYEKSIELYPQGTMAYQNLAVVYGLLKDYENEERVYKGIVERNPNSPEGYFGLANSYMMASKFDEALENAEKALDIYKGTDSNHLADGYYMVGLIHYYKGDGKTAKTYLKLAQNEGADIHPQLVKELLSDGDKIEYTLEKAEDFAQYEQDVIDGHNWLLENKLGTNPTKRQNLSVFIMDWVEGSPNVLIELNEKVLKYTDCGECLMIFLGGWSKYSLESRDFKNMQEGALAGTLDVIQFYLNNKKVLGKNKAIEKLIKLKEKNELKSFIYDNMK